MFLGNHSAVQFHRIRRWYDYVQDLDGHSQRQLRPQQQCAILVRNPTPSKQVLHHHRPHCPCHFPLSTCDVLLWLCGVGRAGIEQDASGQWVQEYEGQAGKRVQKFGKGAICYCTKKKLFHCIIITRWKTHIMDRRRYWFYRVTGLFLKYNWFNE